MKKIPEIIPSNPVEAELHLEILKLQASIKALKLRLKAAERAQRLDKSIRNSGVFRNDPVSIRTYA